MLVTGLLSPLFPSRHYVVAMATWRNLTCTDCRFKVYLIICMINLYNWVIFLHTGIINLVMSLPLLQHSLVWSPCSSDKSLIITAACVLDTWLFICWTDYKINLFKAAPHISVHPQPETPSESVQVFELFHFVLLSCTLYVNIRSGYQRQRGKSSNNDENGFLCAGAVLNTVCISSFQNQCIAFCREIL